MDNPIPSASSAWPTAATHYNLHKRIGNGAFSSVWKAACTANTVDVAIKIMDLEQITTSFEDILQEVQTMRLCDNVNVLRCFCSFVQKDELWLVTELMDRGSCLRVMNVARHYGFGEGMNEEWLAYILQEALQGLQYLHSNGQIHRDIKSGNILLDSRGNVRIADFGVSGWTLARGQRQETVKTFVGTPCWMAPEVMEQLEGYDHRADIWSIGITALELAKGMAPYAKYPPMRVLVLTIEEDPPSLKSYDNDRQRTGAPFSRMYEDFVRKCLQKQPKARPSAEELLKHKFLKGRTKDALLHQLLDHVSAVGTGEDPDQEEEGGSSVGSSGASFFRDAGSVGSKSSVTNAELNIRSVDSVSGEQQLVRKSSFSNSSRNKSGTSKVSFDAKYKENNASNDDTSVDKDFVSGTTWVFDNSLSESGVISALENDSSEDEGNNNSKPKGEKEKNPRRRRVTNEEDDDLGDFLDGFDRETATMKSTGNVEISGSGSDNAPVVGHEFASSHENRYNLPREGSMVLLDCGSIVSSLNSVCNDDIVCNLLDGNTNAVSEEQIEVGPLGAAKDSVFEFDDRRKSDELRAEAGGTVPGPILNSLNNKMVTSLRGNEALERLIGSGLYKSATSSPTVSAMLSNSQSGISQMKGAEDDEEDLDIFLDGFEEETADMNF